MFPPHCQFFTFRKLVNSKPILNCAEENLPVISESEHSNISTTMKNIMYLECLETSSTWETMRRSLFCSEGKEKQDINGWMMGEGKVFLGTFWSYEERQVNLNDQVSAVSRYRPYQLTALDN